MAVITPLAALVLLYVTLRITGGKPYNAVCNALHDVRSGFSEIAARLPRGFLLIGIGLATILFTALGARPAAGGILLLAAALLVYLASRWLEEFRFLMELGDDVFPGRNDKLIWALLLIVLPPVGIWLFSGYRAARWPQKQAAKGDAQADFS